MDNSQMKPNRYLRWHTARQLYRKIAVHLAKGGRIAVGSYTRPTIYRSIDQFRCGKDGVYVARGKHWDSLQFSPIAFIE